MSSARARASASSPHGYQSTGLSACWSRYGRGLVGEAVGHRVRLPRHVPPSRNRHRARRAGGRRPLLATPSSPAGCCSARARSRSTRTTRRAGRGDSATQTRRCLENLAVVAAAAGARSPTPCAAHLRHRHGDVREVNEVYGELLRERAAGPRRDRRRRAAAGRRRSRSTRSSRCRTDDRHRRTTSRRRGRRSSASRAARRCCRSRTLSERAGGTVALKAENLQRTGSFKVRGASAKLARARRAAAPRRRGRLGGQPRPGARRRGPRPRRAVRGLRARRRADRQGRGARAGTARRCTSAASASTSASPPRAERAREAGWPSCTPSTTPTSSPARARSGSSCSRTCRPRQRRRPGRRRRAGGRHRHRGQVRAARGRGRRRAGRRLRALPGVAARGEPGARRLGADDRRRHRRQAPGRADARRCCREWVDDIVVVGEDEIAEAMVLLLERAKLVVEGAGAVGVAALLGGQVARRAAAGRRSWCSPAATSTPACSPSIARRHETEAGRRLVLFTAWRTAGRARRGCSRSSPRRAPTSSTSRTCARASTSTCARPPSSSCSRRAGAITPPQVLAALRDAGYAAEAMR